MSDHDHLYADSAQAREADRRRSQPLDYWGNPIQPASDFCHDYAAPNTAERREQEKGRKARLKVRLEGAMQQMEAFLNGGQA